MLTTLTPEGIRTIRDNPRRIQEVNKEVEQLGATVKAQWATLGRFDFVNVIEALAREPTRHSRAAHEIAETYLDSDKVLSRLIEAVDAS